MLRRHASFGPLLLLLLAACSSNPAPAPGVAQPSASAAPSPGAPLRTRVDSQQDDYFGTKVADPYRWLEDAESEEVQRWTAAENARTSAYLSTIAALPALTTRIESLLSRGYVGRPTAVGVGKNRLYFHTKREGSQNQPTLYVRRDGNDQVLLDVSALSADGTSALDWWFASPKGRYVAWGRSENGDEESTLLLRDVATGEDLPGEAIDRARHASVAWLPDESGFYYTRYPAKGSVPPGDEKYGAKVYFHRIDAKSPQSPDGDALIFASAGDKTDVPSVQISPDGRWVLVSVHQGWDKSELHLWDRKTHAQPRFEAIASGVHARYAAEFAEGQLIVHTNDGAPNFQLFGVPLARAAQRSSWRVLLPETSDALNGVAMGKHGIVATYLHDASTVVRWFTAQGKARAEIALPQVGSASVETSGDGRETFLSFTSYAVPSEVHRVDLSGTTPRLEPWSKTQAGAVPGVEVQRRFATSKDGTKVPYFVVRKGTPSSKATVLYGYGGFTINQTPSYSARAMSVVESGATWVSAVLRGGGEYGEAWHRAGMLDKKQNVFDDFHAVALDLIAQGDTDTDHLGILGGSNGGLLVAASVVQHPETFRAAASLVPLTDMLRYQHFRIAKLWIPEYGSSANEKDFRTLFAYSPYHRVQDGVRYPATLFATAESDSRVDPMHARKMAARLAAAQRDAARPVLLRVESKAGHGAGKPLRKQAEELRDELGFLLHELGAL